MHNKLLSGIILCIIFLPITLYAQTQTIILQPGPGLNNGTDDGTATRGKDTGFTLSQPWGLNDGSSPDIELFNSPCNIGVFPGFLQFSLNNMPTQNIVNAEIQVYARVSFNGAGWPWPVDPIISLRRVTQNWDEMAITQASQPSFDATIIDSHTIDTVGGSGSPFIEYEDWITFNITNLYKDWASGNLANNGIVLHIDNVYCANGDLFTLHSSDYSDPALRPRLVVTYTEETVSVPTMTEWGMIIFMALAGLGSIHFLRKKRRTANSD